MDKPTSLSLLLRYLSAVILPLSFTTSACDRTTPYGLGPSSSQAHLVTIATKEEAATTILLYPVSRYILFYFTSVALLFPSSLEGTVGEDGCVSWAVSCCGWMSPGIISTPKKGNISGTKLRDLDLQSKRKRRLWSEQSRAGRVCPPLTSLLRPVPWAEPGSSTARWRVQHTGDHSRRLNPPHLLFI